MMEILNEKPALELSKAFKRDLITYMSSDGSRKFKNLDVKVGQDKEYYFSKDEQENEHLLRDKFEDFEDKDKYATGKKIENVKQLGSLGLGAYKELKVKIGEQEVEGN